MNEQMQWPGLASAEDEHLRERLLALHERALAKDQNAVSRQEEVLARWPRVTAHLICHSLGYFSPRSAANAILATIHDMPFWCEWYSHQVACREKYGGDADIISVGRDSLDYAIQNRHRHTGYMNHYAAGLRAVASELYGCGPELASWF